MASHLSSAALSLASLYICITKRQLPNTEGNKKKKRKGTTYVKSKTIRRSSKSDLGTLGEEKHIPRRRSDLLTGLIGNLKLALENDLHLIVGIFVY